MKKSITPIVNWIILMWSGFLLLQCYKNVPYICQSNDQCQEIDSICIINRCAIKDSKCISGYRFSPSAKDKYSACVTEDSLNGLDQGLSMDSRKSDTKTDIHNIPLLDAQIKSDYPRTDSNTAPFICPLPPQTILKCVKGYCPINRGCFNMGSPLDEPCRLTTPNKETLHPVQITYDFEIFQDEVSVGAYGSNSVASECKLDTCPVAYANWHQATQFANKWTKANLDTIEPCYVCTGEGDSLTCVERITPIWKCMGYRLPTEAEWENAYRSGSEKAYYNGFNGDKDYCLNCPPQNTPNRMQIAAIAWSKCSMDNPMIQSLDATPYREPNAREIYNMAGNAIEWVNDWFQNDLGSQVAINPVGPPKNEQGLRVLRGGSSWSFPQQMRAAARFAKPPSHKENGYGFRLARTLKID